MSAALEAALAYAARGIPVLPIYPIRGGTCTCPAGPACKSTGKHPIPSLVPEGLKNASADPETIRTWWTRWPDANIAARLGPGVGVVLDVDPRHGGDKSLAELIAENGGLPTGPVVRTGGGGTHYWFLHPGGSAPIAHGFRPGLDFQGDNSYVLLPPSSHASGGSYSWAVDLGQARLPLLPAWLFRAAVEARETNRGNGVFTAGADGRIPHGRHHDFIVSTAASLAKRIPGISESDLIRSVRAAMREVLDDPGDHERELIEAVRSALSKFGRPAPDTPTPSPAQPTAPPTPEAPAGPPAPDIPEGLFITDPKTGNVRAAFPEFVEWFRRSGHYVVPIERDTFSSGGNFELLRYEGGYYNGAARSFIRGWVEQAHRSKGLAPHDSFREEVVRGIANTREFHRLREEFNPPELLCLQNGILDTRTGQLTPHDPGIVFTWRMPVVYDPTATCPTFDRFLERVMPDTARRDLVVDLMGYCLWRRNPFQIFVVNVGDGSNGKTTWLRVMEEIFGPDAIAAETLQSLSSQRFAPAELEGKLVNLCDDLPFDRPLQATGTLKMLTGEGHLSGERKFQAKFHFRFDGKLIANANRTPEVRDDTYAFWRRLVVIPWEATISGSERDPNLIGKLRAEKSGILNLMLRGLARVRSRNEFDPDGVFEGSKEEWHARADPIRAELIEDYAESKDGFVTNSDLYTWHVEKSRAAGRDPLSQKAFGIRVTTVFPLSRTQQQYVGGRRVWGRTGITRKMPQPELDESALADAQQRLDSDPVSPKTPSTLAVPVSRQETGVVQPELHSVFHPELKTQNGGTGASETILCNSGCQGLAHPPQESTENQPPKSCSDMSEPDAPNTPAPEPERAGKGVRVEPDERPPIELNSGSNSTETTKPGRNNQDPPFPNRAEEAGRYWISTHPEPFDRAELRAYLMAGGYGEADVNMAMAHICGDTLPPVTDEDDTDQPHNPRPLGRTHYTCSHCVLGQDGGHDCRTCPTCTDQERRRERRHAREAREEASRKPTSFEE